MRTRLRSKVTLLFIVCAALLAIAGTALALTTDTSGSTSPALAIQSDKDDYAPGETVTLTGSGWQPGESVHINVNDNQTQPWSRDVDVTADDSGSITDQFQLPTTFAALYNVTATGAQSGVATTTFTDGNVTLHLTNNEGVTQMTVNWARFDGSTNCGGANPPAPSASGTLTITAAAPPVGGTVNIPGFGGNTDSVRLTNAATTTSGKTFDKWTNGTGNGGNVTDTGTTTPGSPTPCISNGSGGTNGNLNDIYAHFKNSNQAPVAVNDSLTTNEDTAGSVNVLTNDTDADNNTLTVTNKTNGANGSVSCTTAGVCTYTPNGNFNGSDSFTYTVSDGNGGTATGTVNVTVTAVNDAPSFTKGADQTVNEDSGAHSVTGWATAISAGPANESSQTLDFQVTNNNNSLFTATGQPQVSANGTLSYTLAADASGTATVTVKLHDNGGTANGGVDTSAAQTFTITVNSVNDAPSFTKGANQTVNEDAGAQTVNGWATAISAGPNESGQTVNFIVTNDNNGLFASGGQPAVDASGKLTYTPAADKNGSATVTIKAKDSGGTANGGVDESAAQTFTITVNSVNDAPSFTKGANETVNEDSGVHSVSGWATAISAGPADENGQALDFQVTNDNNALFTTGGQPQIAPNGTLSYTLAADAHGAAMVTVKLHDNGGTANGGVDTSAAQTFTITVNAVNDAPSFQLQANPDQTVNEDATAQSVSGFVTSFSAGPNESGQTVDFQVTNNNNSLFTAGGQPAIDASGKLTYEAAPNASGNATVTVKAHDDGGTANGGVDTSAAQTFTITVNAVNDAPSFTKGADEMVNEDSGAHSVSGWATAISAGPADENGQALDFQVTNDNNALFTTGGQPQVSANGTLSYTLADNANGNATVTVKLHDDGGTANGGVDTSAAQTFTITINAVNDAPSFTKGADETVNEDSGAHSVTGWATDISKGPADENGQTLDFQVTNDNNSLFTAGGQPQIAPNGTLTYTLADNANGNATVTVKLHDNGGTANGGVDTSAAQTFTITVNGVNDAPSFTKGGNETVNEDSGAHSVTGWATAISAGPNESGQTVDFIVTNDNNALFTATGQPKVSPTGDLSYTLAADASGNATVTVKLHDDGGTANGGVDTSAAQTFTITINAVNDAPSFTKGADQTKDEDAGAQSVTGWATDISKGPADENGQTLDFIVTNNNSSLFTATGQPKVSPTGDLSYTLADNANGVATVDVKLHDNGGTANGGVDTSASQTFTITVNSVNDAPVVTFTDPTGDTQTLDEDKTTTRLYKYTVTDVDNANPTVTESCGSGGSLKPDESGDPTQNSFRCLFADDATTTVSATANDGEASNNTGSDSIAVTVNNVAPKVNLTGPTTANEGDTKTYSFTITDPGADTFNFPTGYPTCGAYGNLVGTPTTGDGQFQCTFTDGDNFTDVAVKVADDNGGVSVADTEHVEIITVAVANVNPTVTVPTTNPTPNEGASASFDLGSFTDPGPDSPWAVDVDWGDSSTHGTATKTATGPLGSMSHTYADNGTKTITVKVTDKNGGSDTKSFQVTVNNVAPTITGITVSPLQALIGQPVSFTGTATDPSSVDTAQGFSWQWSKDGGTYAAGANPFSTTFSTCGSHSVSAKATDKDQGTSAPFSASTSVQVYSGNWLPPLQVGKDNLVQKGQVVPVKISVAGCDGLNLAGLNPEIRLAKGDPTVGINESDYTVPGIVAAADTSGFMRPVSDGYIYNLRIPSDTSVKANDMYTIRVSPFGLAAGQHMVIAVQIRK